MEKNTNNVENFDEAKFIDDCHQFLKDEQEKQLQEKATIEASSDIHFETAKHNFDSLLETAKGDYVGIISNEKAQINGHGIDGKSTRYVNADIKHISNEEGMMMNEYLSKLDDYFTNGIADNLNIFEKVLADKHYQPKSLVKDNELSTVEWFADEEDTSNGRMTRVYLGDKEVYTTHKVQSMSEPFYSLLIKFNGNTHYPNPKLNKFTELTSGQDSKYADMFQDLLKPGYESCTIMGLDCNKETLLKFKEHLLHKLTGVSLDQVPVVFSTRY